MRPHVAKERRWRNVSLPELLRSRDLPCSGVDNHTASSAKENENKNKRKPFHFLSFVFPNRDFSNNYERKGKKIRLPLNSRPRL
jgi:hypothetical protein